jgi:hypothetical protein
MTLHEGRPAATDSTICFLPNWQQYWKQQHLLFCAAIHVKHSHGSSLQHLTNDGSTCWDPGRCLVASITAAAAAGPMHQANSSTISSQPHQVNPAVAG